MYLAGSPEGRYLVPCLKLQLQPGHYLSRPPCRLLRHLLGCRGESGDIASHMTPGAVVLLTSTGGIGAVENAAKRLKEIGLNIVDAPVSGGPVPGESVLRR